MLKPEFALAFRCVSLFSTPTRSNSTISRPNSRPFGASCSPFGELRAAFGLHMLGIPTTREDADALGRTVRRDARLAATGNEVVRVVPLVGTDRRAAPTLAANHPQRCFALGGAVGGCRIDIDDEAVAVLHQDVAHVRKPRLGAVRLAKQLRVRIGARRVGVVDSPLPFEINLRVASRPGRRSAAVFRLETLVRCPRLDQRAIDAEVLAAGELSPLRKRL